MENIDEVTLKLMSNKSQYNKYLSKSNPEKYKENAEYMNKRAMYADDIMDTVKSILFSDKDITNNINESFEHFVKECIQYYEMKSFEKKGEHENENDDDDIMFGKMYNENARCNKTSANNDENHKNNKNNKNISNYAYWGKKNSTMNPNVNMSNYMYSISP